MALDDGQVHIDHGDAMNEVTKTFPCLTMVSERYLFGPKLKCGQND